MKCPKCNTTMISVKGKNYDNTCRVHASFEFGSVKVREYDCLNCGERIGTVETVVKDYKSKKPEVKITSNETLEEVEDYD